MGKFAKIIFVILLLFLVFLILYGFFVGMLTSNYNSIASSVSVFLDEPLSFILMAFGFFLFILFFIVGVFFFFFEELQILKFDKDKK